MDYLDNYNFAHNLTVICKHDFMDMVDRLQEAGMKITFTVDGGGSGPRVMHIEFDEQ